MNNKIFVLTDYNENFGSKYGAIPYKSGFNKKLLSQYFTAKSYITEFISFADINLREMNFRDQYVLYTSSEDIGYRYKSYIEDICYAIHLQGGILLPDFKYLKAHCNKVFMELLRDLANLDEIKNIKSAHFGSLEELRKRLHSIQYPCVIKGFGGAKSMNVALGKNKSDLIKKVTKISDTKEIKHDLWDLGRSYKHKGYIRESRNRAKFVIQNFISDLPNDWKILIFNKSYYILNRKTRDNDFRASGSGIFSWDEDMNSKLLDYAKSIYQELNVPVLGIDVGFDGTLFYLIEFQAIYFGTFTFEEAPLHFEDTGTNWTQCSSKTPLEMEFANSVIAHIVKQEFCS